VPSEQYKAQQKIMAQTLIAAGLSPEQIASMLFSPLDPPSGEKPKDERPKDDMTKDLSHGVASPLDTPKPTSRS
jgi:hypothetical protein